MNLHDKVNTVFTNLQNLQLQPTEHNVMLLSDCMIQLKEIYAGLPEDKPEEKEGDEDVQI